VYRLFRRGGLLFIAVFILVVVLVIILVFIAVIILTLHGLHGHVSTFLTSSMLRARQSLIVLIGPAGGDSLR
jgi:hypothetical protein